MNYIQIIILPCNKYEILSKLKNKKYDFKLYYLTIISVSGLKNYKMNDFIEYTTLVYYCIFSIIIIIIILF